MADLDKLQGTWNVAALEVDGQAMAAPPGACIVIEGARFQSLGMGAVYAGTIELNARKRPRQFDLLFTEGPEQGNRSLGIYGLSGDEWKICLTVTGKTRPEKFSTAPGGGHALEILRRGPAAQAREVPEQPAAAAAPTPSTANDPAPEIEGEWRMTACHADGDPVPDAVVRTGRRVARNGETTSWFGKQLLLHARYTVDRSVDPHAIDYTLNDGRRQFGIWQLEGATLHICFAAPGKPRPADFTVRRGQGHTFTSWTRSGE